MFAKDDPEHDSKLECGKTYDWKEEKWMLVNYRRSTDRAIIQKVRFWQEVVSLKELEGANNAGN
jgi:hypothetical protein